MTGRAERQSDVVMTATLTGSVAAASAAAATSAAQGRIGPVETYPSLTQWQRALGLRAGEGQDRSAQTALRLNFWVPLDAAPLPQRCEQSAATRVRSPPQLASQSDAKHDPPGARSSSSKY